MSIVPVWYVFALGLFALVGLSVAALVNLRMNLPKVASFLSRGTVVVTVLYLVVLATTLFGGGPIRWEAPITPMPLRLAQGLELDGLTTAILSGGADRVTVEATGLSPLVRVLGLLTGVLAGATLVGVCLVVDRLARSLGEGDPFALGGNALRRAAWIVLLGGVLSSVVGDLADWRASHELFWVDGASWSGDGEFTSLTDLGWPEPASLALTIPFWPLGAALVLALLAGVFRYGHRLRRDTEGLV
ncbi:MAG: hypothetical protein QM804_01460 [Propionicimonas sp.]